MVSDPDDASELQADPLLLALSCSAATTERIGNENGVQGSRTVSMPDDNLKRQMTRLAKRACARTERSARLVFESPSSRAPGVAEYRTKKKRRLRACAH
jgi:hypothetical protein